MRAGYTSLQPGHTGLQRSDEAASHTARHGTARSRTQHGTARRGAAQHTAGHATLVELDSRIESMSASLNFWKAASSASLMKMSCAPLLSMALISLRSCGGPGASAPPSRSPSLARSAFMARSSPSWLGLGLGLGSRVRV